VVVLVLSLYVLFWPDPAGGGSGPPGSDKAVHLLLFAGLAASARARFGDAPTVLVVVAGYAVLSELVQALVLSGRSGDLLDVVADLGGAALGWWLAGRRRPAAEA
jgi:VanZ family protein